MAKKAGTGRAAKPKAKKKAQKASASSGRKKAAKKVAKKTTKKSSSGRTKAASSGRTKATKSTRSTRESGRLPKQTAVDSAELRKKVAELELVVRRSDEDAQRATGRVEELERTLEAARENGRELAAEARTATEAATAREAAASGEVEALQARLAEATRGAEELELAAEGHDALRADLERLQGAFSDLEGELNGAREQAAAAETTRDQLSRSLDDAQRTTEREAAALEEARAERNALQSELAEGRERLENTEAALASAKIALADLKGELQSAHCERDASRSDLAEAAQDLEGRKRILEELKSSLAAEREKLQSHVNQIRADVQKRMAEEKTKFRSQHDELLKAQAEVASLQAALEKRDDDLSDRALEVEEVRKDRDKLKTRLEAELGKGFFKRVFGG